MQPAHPSMFAEWATEVHGSLESACPSALTPMPRRPQQQTGGWGQFIRGGVTHRRLSRSVGEVSALHGPDCSPGKLDQTNLDMSQRTPPRTAPRGDTGWARGMLTRVFAGN